MRIYQVHVRYRQPGGEDAVVEQDAVMLRDAGHEVGGFHANNPVDRRRATQSLLRAPWNRSAARTVSVDAATWRADVAHVHNTWFALSAAVLPALRAQGIPTVMTLHNYRTTCLNATLLRGGRPCYDCVSRTSVRGVVHRCYRGSATQSLLAGAAVDVARRGGTWSQHVDAFVVLSEHARAFFAAAGLPPGKLHVVPNVLADVSEHGSAPARSRRLLFVGRLSPEKGLVSLLEAWRLAAPVDLRLDVVGDGPLRGELERTLPRGVRLLGHLDRQGVQELLADARALVVPSVWDEMFPRTMVEAFAAGTPVLASKRAGPEAMLNAASCGRWLVDPGVESWREALHRLSAGDLGDDLARASAAVRRYYEQELTVERGVARLEAVYRSVLVR